MVPTVNPQISFLGGLSALTLCGRGFIRGYMEFVEIYLKINVVKDHAKKSILKSANAKHYFEYYEYTSSAN